ncbi:BTB/POZ and MATH domain-containing protein 2-like [Panicum virgatum]|uniref:BTB/POZ and MATH domain-containing protein 2-like n=1 Tax=Panicum virgatum TaxID=38727 RepID=UPI0019D5F403|nr:BTB/POZ and MATH domain-containing protein 2-like [Panicum virgatum]
MFDAGQQLAVGGSSSAAAPGHSASTIAVEEVTGSHVLTVDGYTRTKKGLVAGQVRCDITVLKETARDNAAAAAAAARYVAVPPPDMGRDLDRLLSSGEGADVAFEVGGETVAAHRSILAQWRSYMSTKEGYAPLSATVLAARSLALLAELFAPAPGAAVCVWVEGVDVEVFWAVLRFVYKDTLPELEEGGGEAAAMAPRLLAAADRYGLERLKLICKDRLCDDVDASTVGTALELAERHGCQGLKRACLDFLMAGSNLKAATATGDFEHLSNSCPSVLKELLDKVTSL